MASRNTNKKIKWVGIDFGTTNSAAISFVDEGHSIGRFGHGDDQGTPFPSIVGINKQTGEVITGRDAKNRRIELSENYEFFTSIKSIIDKDDFEEESRFRVLNSMRSVETSVQVIARE